MAKNKLKVLELFGGIGACSKALEKLNVDFEIADYVEIDKYAVKSFNAIHGTNFEPQDIIKWDKDIQVDLIMHGSPCQDFSVAGKGAGGDEGSGTRSSLMYETLRIVEELKPKYVIWENVKNILSKKHIYNWECYCNRMNELGYCNWCQVMNAKDYGVPQNRERVFTVSIRKDVSDKEFIFPEPIPLEKRLKDILEHSVDEKYYVKKTPDIKFTDSRVQWDSSGKGYNSQQDRAVYDYGLAPTLSSCNGSGDKAQVCILGDSYNSEKSKEFQKDDYFTAAYRIRKLTPKECWRLMGFDDSDFEKAEKVNSKTQLYKQAGNSIVVDVIERILTELLIEEKYGKRK